jgi:drug/metabolite transporter (DMT)-like permease
MTTNYVYLLALGANLAFATGSIIFTKFSRQISSVWMNTVKAGVALVFFFLTVSIFGEWHPISLSGFSFLFFSGMIGLGIGDIYLLKAFERLGSGRTLMMFSFQPILLGGLAWIFLDQKFEQKNIFAIVFFMACILTFSLETFKKKGEWEIKGIVYALICLCLDGIGLIITRKTFDQFPDVSPIEGNFYRTIGALLVFFIISRFRPIGLVSNFKKLSSRDKKLCLFGGFLGTFLSLSLFLTAIKYAHLATLSGISITGTIFASSIECFLEKKWPSKYLLSSFIFFFFGMKILFF